MANWLEQHGGSHLEVVSRDRGGAFADGACQGAPQAVRVADRFHLLQGLGQALDQLLTREQRVLSRVADALSAASKEQVTVGEPSSPAVPELPVAPVTRLERQHTEVELRRQARYEQVVALAGDGHSLREVARRAGLSRGTVRRYLRASQYQPCVKHARRIHRCDAYAAYLRQRWEEGEHNSAAIYAEIQEQGFTGAASIVRQYVRGCRTGPRHPGRRRRAEDAAGKPPRQRHYSLRQTRWILLRPVDELDADERAYREAPCQESTTIATAQALV